MTPKVFCLVTERNATLAPTARLAFDSVRVGFPDAAITFYSNSSPATDDIKQRAAAIGARTVMMSKEITHAEWLEAMIGINSGAVAIIDPDVMFWENVQGWDFGDAALAGRAIPEYVDGHNQNLITKPRLHPSFWWIPDTTRLWTAIEAVRGPLAWSGGDLWKPFEQYVDVARYEFWDTGAQLCAGLKGLTAAFDERHLGSYDHLFGGSTPEYQGKLLGHRGLERGLWKVQERHFKRRSIGNPA